MYLRDFSINGRFKPRGNDNGGVQHVGLCKAKNRGCPLCSHGDHLIGYRLVDVFISGFSKPLHDLLHLHIKKKSRKFTVCLHIVNESVP